MYGSLVQTRWRAKHFQELFLPRYPFTILLCSNVRYIYYNSVIIMYLCDTYLTECYCNASFRVQMGDFDAVPVEVESSLTIHELKKVLADHPGIRSELDDLLF